MRVVANLDAALPLKILLPVRPVRPVARSSVLQGSSRVPFTIEDMRRFASEAWGALGAQVVDKWDEFNADYFAGTLRPVPLVNTNTLPFARRFASRSYGGST